MSTRNDGVEVMTCLCKTMEGSTSTAVLVDAKREYLAQLSDYVSPVILSIVDDMWNLCSSQKKPLIAFMTKLKSVPEVNNATIATWTARVSDKCPWLSELLAAVFVSYVKVLNSVRLGNVKPKIKLKVPSNETFIHSVIVDYAHDLYGDPYLIQRTDTESKTARLLLVRKSIETNVRNLLPVKDILNAYVSGSSMHNREFTPEPQEQSEDEDQEDQDNQHDHSNQDDHHDQDDQDEFASQHQSPSPDAPYQEPSHTEPLPTQEVIQDVAPQVTQPVLTSPQVTHPQVTQPGGITQPVVIPPQAHTQLGEHRTIPLAKPVGYDDAEELE